MLLPGAVMSRTNVGVAGLVTSNTLTTAPWAPEPTWYRKLLAIKTLCDPTKPLAIVERRLGEVGSDRSTI